MGERSLKPIITISFIKTTNQHVCPTSSILLSIWKHSKTNAKGSQGNGWFPGIDNITKNQPQTLTLSDVRCFQKGCHGMIKTTLMPMNEKNHWFCHECETERVINGWQKTKWDNYKRIK